MAVNACAPGQDIGGSQDLNTKTRISGRVVESLPVWGASASRPAPACSRVPYAAIFSPLTAWASYLGL